MPEKIDKAECNATIHIEDEVWFLLGGYLLHLPGVVQEGCGGEVLLSILADESDPLVWVVNALRLVPDTHDQDTLLLGLVNKTNSIQSRIKNLRLLVVLITFY